MPTALHEPVTAARPSGSVTARTSEAQSASQDPRAAPVAADDHVPHAAEVDHQCHRTGRDRPNRDRRHVPTATDQRNERPQLRAGCPAASGSERRCAACGQSALPRSRSPRRIGHRPASKRDCRVGSLSPRKVRSIRSVIAFQSPLVHLAEPRPRVAMPTAIWRVSRVRP